MLVRNPQAPRGLFDGIAFDGSMAGAYRGGTYYHDASGYGHHGTLTNMDPATDWVWSEELGRWGLDFDGSNDYIAFPNLSPHFGTQATVVMWVRSLATGVGTDTGSWHFNVPALGSNNHYTYGGNIYDGTFKTARVWVGASSVTLAEWHQVAITSSPGANQWKFYQNATIIKTDAGDAAISMPTAPTLGKSVRTYYFKGQIADPLIYNRALTPPEIQWFASPANHLRVPWRRTVWPVVSAAAAFNPAWARNCNNLIGAGI